MSAQPTPSPRSAPTLRALRESDLAAALAIERRSYEFPWTPGIFLDCLRAGYDAWLLESGGEAIGYTVVSVGAGEAHVLNLCVAPEWQGRGHGKRLLRCVLDTARWRRAERVFLEVRPSNPAAQALYRQAGFNEIGIRPNYYPARHGREDAVVMALELLPET